MKKLHSVVSALASYRIPGLISVVLGMLLLQSEAAGQTFDFPSVTYVDTLLLRDVVTTPDPDTLTVQQNEFASMTSATNSSNGFKVKSIIALTNFKVDVQSPDVGQKQKFTYLITYKTIGTVNPVYPAITVSSDVDTLSVSYNRDSLTLISDQAFTIAGNYHRLKIVIIDVVEITESGSGPVYTVLQPGDASTVPTFVHVLGEIHMQKFVDLSSMAMTVDSVTDNIGSDGTVVLDWTTGFADIKPAGYEVEWTYCDPSAATFDFRNNATRVFTNKTSFKIPVAQRQGHLVYRVRMVRPELTDLMSRNYGDWTLADQGALSGSSVNPVTIPKSYSDSLNWDMKMSFVEDGKYKQVLTYYDGLLKPKQVQTRFNSRPHQTVVAQSLFDFEGRAVINTLPIPVDSIKKFSYINNFLHPVGASEFEKLWYDSLPDPLLCPPKEYAIPPLDSNALSNRYYSRFKVDKTGKNAFIPDAEGYPLVRKILAAENSEKVLFEGQAGAGLQLGNDRHTAYLYGSPIQAELNKYFGQDIGKANYYRKMITTDNHQQDMFSITDDDGRPVASGLIGSPDTNSLALSIRNSPVSDSFKSNLLPVPDFRIDEHWFHNGSYFVERDANYSFEYRIDYKPFKPCSSIPYRLTPKVYYNYAVFDDCGNLKVADTGTLGEIGYTTDTSLAHSYSVPAFLEKGNHVWSKYSYVKLKDLTASVDQYLALTNGCYLTFNDFLKEEFINSEFPCDNKMDPCDAMRLKMIKEMYPDAKYGKYAYADSVSKTFGGQTDNSIFTLGGEGKGYRYQDSCIIYPDTVYSGGTKYYNIHSLQPQQLIDMFNDSIGAALLPLHPDYCKLQLCDIINNPYCKMLGGITKAANADSISRYDLADIINNDPLKTNNILTVNDLSRTADEDLSIDSLAFKRTLCGSELSAVASACDEINENKDLQDLPDYPEYIRDEYYRKLIELYSANREIWISRFLDESGDSCGPCPDLRLVNYDDTTTSSVDDTTFLVMGMDSMSANLNTPANSSFSTFFSAPGSITMDSVNNLANIDNSIYCTQQVESIMNALSDCDVSQATLDALRDTLEQRFCTQGHSITSVSYDSLNSMLTELGITPGELCNAGLADLRRITRSSGDFVQLGIIQYPPQFYNDLAAFVTSNQLLSYIATGTGSLNVSLRLCNNYPFELNLARQLGSQASNCSTTLSVTVTKNMDTAADAVQLTFTANGESVDYFLYPGDRTDTNALNAAFGTGVISGATDFVARPLFSLYGFDRLSKSFANRNTVLLGFEGTRNSFQGSFNYFFSAFNEQTDYSFMEKDEKDYLNGVGCSEFVTMAEEVVTEAAQLNIKFGSPKFETYFTNMLNYRNNINFDYENYNAALQSCALTDSFVIQKYIAHFRIKVPSSVNTGNLIDSISVADNVGLSNAYVYKWGSDKYLLLDIFEANGLSIKEAKQRVQNRVAAISNSNIQYLPSQQRDTIALLLSSNFNPVNINSLTNAFPGATISSDNITHYYGIPGYGNFQSAGKIIHIVKSIDVDYYYNHYVDSVLRYVAKNAPMTIVLNHAESAVSSQYAHWQMKAWRDYIKTIADTNHNELIKKSKAAQFNALSASSGSSSFATSKFSYLNARLPHYLNDLYIDHTPTGNTNFTYISNLLYALEAYNHTNSAQRTIFKPHGHQNFVTAVANTETRAYVCGDTSYFWINHFDTAGSMINVFVKMPEYLALPRHSYKIYSVRKGFEKDSITYLSLVFTGQQGGYKDTIYCIAYANRNLGATYTIPAAFLSSHSQHAWTTDRFENCETRKIETLYPAANINYNLYIDSMRTVLISQFRQHVIDSLRESLNIWGTDIKHGVTLYYYDMAGNLISTVSPAGVDKLSVLGADNDTINAHRLRNEQVNPLVPDHSKITSYEYNAQNKVLKVTTPDAGDAVSVYDLMGRVAVSQDAQQAISSNYTYFLYDRLSRVVETGVINKPNGWDASYFKDAGQAFNTWVKGKQRTEVTATVYDVPAYSLSGLFQGLPAQHNLKNRVSSTKYFEAVTVNTDAGTDTNYSNALYYSYDLSGNVKTLVHDLRTVVHPSLRIKRVDYEYDLYSGKVVMAAYNRGRADQFYQKYSYDADNRIVDVHTSSQGIFWDRDAHYDYYDHGPLARTDLGEQRVQGVDFAYTINGWLKAINGIQNGPESDMGEDGTFGEVMPKDVFSQRIDYFAGDYKGIVDSNFFNHLPPVTKALYNGNIAGIATALTPFTNLHKKYHYDPLQRIDRAEYADFSFNYNTSQLTTANIPDYTSEYKYDPDGNLVKLNREGGTVSAAMNGGTAITQHNMDMLSYRYEPGNNRLKNLQDSSSSVAYKIDIPPTTGDTNLAHYTYDANGNMTKDLVSGLTDIKWNRFGKVKSISKLDGSTIQFSYDPMGNRLAKEVVLHPTADSLVKLKTVYVRDAAGNSLAVYEDRKEFDLAKLTPQVVSADPGLGFPAGHLPANLAQAIATELWYDYEVDPDDNLAVLAMSVPELEDFAANGALLEDLVTSLTASQALAFLKSLPQITQYTLAGGPEPVAGEKLNLYLQSLLLSMGMDSMQTAFFSALKDSNPDLYYATVAAVPVSESEKEDFPATLNMLEAFKEMEIGVKTEIVYTLASSLSLEQIETLPAVVPVLVSAYSNANSYADFVIEVPAADLILDQLQEDAASYVAYRYGLVDMDAEPLDSVAAEFKYNTVLAGALSGQDIEAGSGSLSIVLSQFFPDVVTLAQNSGKMGPLVSAIKSAVSAIDQDLVPAAWLKTKEILQSDRTNLAEHHIYGSSRLGMQKYLPGMLQYAYAGSMSGPYQSLTKPKPWYSRYGNDLFKSTMYSDSLSVSNMGTSGMEVQTHILGNRHYELTNHLGNVQATVLDRTSPVLDVASGSNAVTGYHADISTAQDYYPFGMLMPGRYTSDTAAHCVTINTTVMVTKPIKITAYPTNPTTTAYQYEGDPGPPLVANIPKAISFEEELMHVFHYLDAEAHPGKWVIQTVTGDGVQYNIDLSNEPAGVMAYYHIHMDTSQVEQQFGFDIIVPAAAIAEMRVRQYGDSITEEYEPLTDWATIETGSHQVNLAVNTNAVLAGGPTILEIKFTPSRGSTFETSTTIAVLNPWTYRTELVPENRVVKICDEKDNYRFGFNGMEKDNEAKGLGNSLDFGNRIYDSRLGRWLSLDPLSRKYPAASPYNFTLNNPIMNRDPDGRDVEVAITRNPAGGGSIVLKSDVYVTGVNSSDIVTSSQKAFNDWKNKDGRTYTDKHGKVWKVEVQMTFKVATADDINRIKNAAAESAGENLLIADLPAGGRAYAGIQGANYNKTRAGKFHGSGNQGHITANDGGRTAIHENLHTVGLGDRYSDVTYKMTVDGESKGRTNTFSKSHVDYEGDVMSDGWEFSQTHVDNLAGTALEVSDEKGSDNFVMGRQVDNSDSKQADKVPTSYKSGNTEYSDPQHQKAK